MDNQQVDSTGNDIQLKEDKLSQENFVSQKVSDNSNDLKHTSEHKKDLDAPNHIAEEQTPENTTSKKKKNKKKKQAGGSNPPSLGLPYAGPNTIEMQDNSRLRCLGNWPEVSNTKQTENLTIPIDKLYQNGKYPIGELQEHHCNRTPQRMSQEELSQLKLSDAVDLADLRRAAECHRQVRKFAQSFIKPGLSMTEICEKIEAKIDLLISHNGLKSGRAFPTGCSLNNCAAHYSPNPGDTRILEQGDICKIDFGAHVNGNIVDSAFTIAFEPHFDNLIEATKEATLAAIREAGADARIYDIGVVAQEVIESYEVEINGSNYLVKPVRNLTGHSISKYQIHAGKSVPIVKGTTRDYNDDYRMYEGEIFAIETFASTGKGYVVDSSDCSHFSKTTDSGFIPLRLKSAKDLLKCIDTNFGTLPFCRRWLDSAGQPRHLVGLKNLIENNIIQTYPPLCDIRHSFTSQSEHTIYIHPHCKEILTKGFDY